MGQANLSSDSAPLDACERRRLGHQRLIYEVP
jgi:hypothetical protein